MVLRVERTDFRMSTKQFIAAATGSRVGFVRQFLGCVDRAEKLDVGAIKGYWWNGILYATCLAACPFLFLLDFDSIALRVMFIALFLWSLWFLMDRFFDGYKTRDFDKQLDQWGMDRLRHWEAAFPELGPFYKANGIHSLGASLFEHDLIQQWVWMQRKISPRVHAPAPPPPSKPVANDEPVLVPLRSAMALVDGWRVASYWFVALGVLAGVIVGAMVIMALIPELGSLREGPTPAHWVVIVAGALAVVLGLIPFHAYPDCPVVSEAELRKMREMGVPLEVVERTKDQVLIVKELD